MKLLIIDPNISLSSPSLKGVVRSLPHLRAAGWEIETWCWHCDQGLPIENVVKLPRIGDVHFISGHAFTVFVRLRSWWLFSVLKKPRPDLVYSVACYEPWCDIALVQFSPFDWELRQRMLGMKSLRDVVERVANLFSLQVAGHFLKRTTARTILCVSEAVRNDLLAENPTLNYRLLPNSYDPERFNTAVRAEHRRSMRAQHGFAPDDVVFAFASAGHYRRKGFFLAVDAVAKLRKQFKQARFLVIGGTAKRLAGLQKQLGQDHPDWREWITFTGMVNDVEKHFAASDAFLFPSYSEAFALVEVEAAACGLPLFLTRHHGSEMIMSDEVNGRYLEFDATQITAVLVEFMSGAWCPAVGTEPPKKGLTTSEYAAALVEIFCSLGADATASPVPPDEAAGIVCPEMRP